jgi:hypothetical protein
MAQKTTLPHSWNLKGWPPEVYPNTPKKARYLARANQDSLAKAGAMVRVGRELVFIGAPYSRWLQKKASRVPGYECPANKPRDAA